jgi:transcription initiation factor TFIIIB Brf1 subunit/transcription initiation factor TFIIB
MQGVQSIRTTKGGRRIGTAEYELWAAVGRCPECTEHLVRTGQEMVCPSCGVVAGAANVSEGSPSPTVSKREPLGSYIVAEGEGATPSLKGPAFGWARLQPNIIGRGKPDLTCSILTDRMAEKLGLPKSFAQAANVTAGRLLTQRKTYGWTIPSISAYSLLYACRAAAIVHISHREVLQTYSDAGYRVRKSDLLRIGLESGVSLPHPSPENFVRAAIAKIQSSEKVAERLRKAGVDHNQYFATLFELSKELAGASSQSNGFNPRTVAAGSVYLASVTMSPKTITQKDAAETLGIKEYTVREYCCRRTNEEAGPVKCGAVHGGHDS